MKGLLSILYGLTYFFTGGIMHHEREMMLMIIRKRVSAY